MKPIDIIFPQRLGIMARKKCVICGGNASVFKDALSVKEYGISGMCQNCQDKTFTSPEYPDPCELCKLPNKPECCKDCPL